MIAVGRMMSHHVQSPGGAMGTGPVLENVRIAIQLLGNPEELRERIETLRARYNVNPQNHVVNILVFTARHACNAYVESGTFPASFSARRWLCLIYKS